MIEEGKKEKVKTMFNSIAPRYDFLNHFLSFGVDFYWRNRVFRMVKQRKPSVILDVATGTGDLAIVVSKAKPKKIIGVDISQSMLAVGNEKIKNKNLGSLITLQIGDSEDLKFEDNYFDLAMVAFGVRNFGDLEKGLSEILRVLKPGGSLLVLEFSHPTSFPMKQLYHFYSMFILPLLGRIISNDRSAYTYLPESVKKFHSGNDFLNIMKKCGFEKLELTSLTAGISTIYSGFKKL